jgi:hypothetical protein
MSELPILHARKPHDHEDLLLVALRATPYHENYELYTLLAVGGDNERPLTVDGSIVFFTQPDAAARALQMDTSLSHLGPAPDHLEAVCDIAESLYLVNSQDADSHGTLLDCLLILDDLVRATRLHMPERHQALLTELTARLTEGRQLKVIFSNPALRQHVEDALLWCVGAVTVKARII